MAWLTAIFPERLGGIGLLGHADPVPIVSYVPLFMFAILFGLSMDYEVFLVSQIRGARPRRREDNKSSVVSGLGNSGAGVILGLEGASILGAGIAIGWYAVERLFHPESLDQLDIGAVLALVAMLINYGVSIVLLRTAEATGSIVLEADGQHLRTDVWTTLGVVGALCVIWLTQRIWGVQILWLDPVVALILAVNIVRTGIGLIRRSFDGLMDRDLTDEEQARVSLGHRGSSAAGDGLPRAAYPSGRRPAFCRLPPPGAGRADRPPRP